MTMLNAAVYLKFQSDMAKITDYEKFYIMNRMVNFINLIRNFDLTDTDYNNPLNLKLEQHLRCTVQNQKKPEWWIQLRKLCSASLFHSTLRQRL